VTARKAQRRIAASALAWNAVYQDDGAVMDAALAARSFPAQELSFLLDEADHSGSADAVARLKAAGAVLRKADIAVLQATLASYVGSYASEDGSKSMTVALEDGVLYASPGHEPFKLAAFTPTYFVQEGKRFPTLRFEVQDGRVVGATLRDAEESTRFTKAAGRAKAAERP